MSKRSQHRQSAAKIFAVPAILAIATIGGLIAGLLGDGVFDWVAALGLGLPVITIAIAMRRA